MEITWLDGSGRTCTGRIRAQIEPFVREVGVETFAEFMMEFGGARVYLSSRPKNSKVTKRFGYEVAIGLWRAMKSNHGSFIPIPMDRVFLCRYLRSTGLKINQISSRLRTSEVTVRRCLKSDDEARRQRESRADASRRRVLAEAVEDGIVAWVKPLPDR
jgi:hypothetical protein